MNLISPHEHKPILIYVLYMPHKIKGEFLEKYAEELRGYFVWGLPSNTPFNVWFFDALTMLGYLIIMYVCKVSEIP